jgi:hypothetical protein
MSKIRVTAALEQIIFARSYVRTLLDDLRPDDWWWQPVEGVTHIGWQVGHLAVAQWSLALRRIRGEQPLDEQLIDADFRGLFGRGSQPHPGAENNPPQEEIRAVFDRVYDEVVSELRTCSDAELDVPSEPKHPAFKTKLGSLIWCSQHELLHAGQIGLVRRMLGKPPLR